MIQFSHLNSLTISNCKRCFVIVCYVSIVVLYRKNQRYTKTLMYNLLHDADIEIQNVDDKVVGRSSGNAWLGVSHDQATGGANHTRPRSSTLIYLIDLGRRQDDIEEISTTMINLTDLG